MPPRNIFLAAQATRDQAAAFKEFERQAKVTLANEQDRLDRHFGGLGTGGGGGGPTPDMLWAW